MSLTINEANKDPKIPVAPKEKSIRPEFKLLFKAKAATSNGAKLLLDTYYSIDKGNNWTIIDNAKELTSSAESYSFNVPSSSSDLVRIKFKIADSSTQPTKSSAQLTIDDIIFY